MESMTLFLLFLGTLDIIEQKLTIKKRTARKNIYAQTSQTMHNFVSSKYKITHIYTWQEKKIVIFYFGCREEKLYFWAAAIYSYLKWYGEHFFRNTFRLFALLSSFSLRPWDRFGPVEECCLHWRKSRRREESPFSSCHFDHKQLTIQNTPCLCTL